MYPHSLAANIYGPVTAVARIIMYSGYPSVLHPSHALEYDITGEFFQIRQKCSVRRKNELIEFGGQRSKVKVTVTSKKFFFGKVFTVCII